MIHVPPTSFDQAEDISGTALDQLFLKNASLNPHPFGVEFAGQIGLLDQGLDPVDHPLRPYQTGVTHTYYVNVPRLRAPSEKVTSPKQDRRRRMMKGPIDDVQMRDLDDARAYAREKGKPLFCAIDINPAKLDRRPAGDFGEWMRSGPLKAMAQHMGRQRDRSGQPVGWFAVGTRESYEDDTGKDREHGHVVCFCPACLRPSLSRMLQQRFPGAGAFNVHEDKDLDEDGWRYRVKQRTDKSAGPPRPRRPTPEKFNRYDGAPVAAVLGKRTFVSRSLSLPVRSKNGWQERREAWRVARRDHHKALAREERDLEADMISELPKRRRCPMALGAHSRS